MILETKKQYPEHRYSKVSRVAGVGFSIPLRYIYQGSPASRGEFPISVRYIRQARAEGVISSVISFCGVCAR